MTKAVIFDCFGVFYPDPIYQYGRLHTIDPNVFSALERLDDSASLGEMDEESFIAQAANLLGVSKGEVREFILKSEIRNTELLDFAESLRSDMKVGLLSNVGVGMMDYCFSSTELTTLFDAFVLSGEEKMAKPNPKIYQLMCDRLAIKPDEALFIDDTPEYCDGAVKAGLRAIRYESNEQVFREIGTLIEDML